MKRLKKVLTSICLLSLLVVVPAFSSVKSAPSWAKGIWQSKTDNFKIEITDSDIYLLIEGDIYSSINLFGRATVSEIVYGNDGFFYYVAKFEKSPDVYISFVLAKTDIKYSSFSNSIVDGTSNKSSVYNTLMYKCSDEDYNR